MADAHLRPGDDLRGRLEAAGWAGEYLAFSDPVCVGPVGEPGLMAYLGQRARFVARHAGADPAAVRARLGGEYAAVSGLGRFARALLWFEHDLWDQAALIRVLSLLGGRAAPEGGLFLMPADGRRPFVALPDAEIAGLSPVPLTAAGVEAGAAAWEAFAAEDPTALDAMSRRALPLPHLAAAMRRHLQDLPWRTDGLALTERQVLRAAAEGAEALPALMTAQHAADPVFPVNDLILKEVAARLAEGPRRLLTPGPPWRITDQGRAVLAGEARHRPAPRFHAGVAVGPEPRWVWEPRAAGVASAVR